MVGLAAQGGIFAAGRAPSSAELKAAQAQLMRDRTLQFDFSKAEPPPNVHLPHWLEALLRAIGAFLRVIAPAFGWIFVGGVALGLGLVLFFIGREIVRTRFPGLGRRRRPARVAPLDWRPDAGAARALLEEADRLAAAGEYEKAVHLILYRSIEEIEGRRPKLVKPALTSREIGALEGVPAAARAVFGHIAQVVERSFFGGRSVDAAGFAECRKAYEDFAFPGAWAA